MILNIIVDRDYSEMKKYLPRPGGKRVASQQPFGDQRGCHPSHCFIARSVANQFSESLIEDILVHLQFSGGRTRDGAVGCRGRI